MLTAMLGCCCIGEQFLNGCPQSGPLRLCFFGSIKEKCLQRLLCLLYVGLQGILFCGTLEAAPSIPSNVRTESKDCGQMVVMVLKDDDRSGLAASGKPKQSVIERSAKCGTGDGNAGGVVVAPSDEASKRGKQDGAKDGIGIGEESFNHFQYWLIIIIALLPIWRLMRLAAFCIYTIYLFSNWLWQIKQVRTSPASYPPPTRRFKQKKGLYLFEAADQFAVISALLAANTA